MIGMVLVTHGKLALEFCLALQHVVGPQDNCAYICIEPDDDMEVRRNDILSAVHDVENGDGVVILTDMFGGTPSNLAISVMQNQEIEVIAGVNLPMLVKLARVRGEKNMQECVREAQDAGRKYINVANDILGNA